MPIFLSPNLGLTYSEAIAEAYASAPEDTIILHTLEFRHPTFIDPDTLNEIGLRVVNDHEFLLATLESTAPLNPSQEVRFEPVRFEFTRPPESDAAATPEVEITVSNVSRILIPSLDTAKDSRIPIEVTYRPYLSTDLTGPHMRPVLTLTLRNVSCSMTDISATAGFGDLSNRKFPKTDYTNLKFPGLAAR
jgi:hypothetical protein